MFQKVDEPNFVAGEHEMLRFWQALDVFRKLQAQNERGEHWSFLDGPITANNPMGVHHAWGRTYKDAFQRYRAMTGRKLRYQNGFDCQGLWVEVEVEKELNLGTKTGIADYGIDRFVRECKKRVLKFAARQTEQSIRLGYWMEWDDPGELRRLSEAIGDESRESRDESREKKDSQGNPFNSQLATLNSGGRETRDESREKGSQRETLNSQLSTLNSPHTYTTARGQTVTEPAEQIAAKLGNPEWGGSYFTFSTENNETIWSFLKKCFERKKIYQGHDVMPWSGRAGSAYSQMEVADGRKLTTHRSCFVRFRLIDRRAARRESADDPGADAARLADDTAEYLLVWTTTPWTLTSNVACAVNPELEYVKLRAKKDGAVYYFAKDNLEYKRLEKEFKEGFGRPEWSWPEGVGKLKSIAQVFKEQGGYEIEGTIKGAEMIGWRYEGPFDELQSQQDSGFGIQDSGTFSGDSKRSADQSTIDHRPSTHPTIDGGRDSKGSAIVVAGDGTGIVHIAPGCGDVDHQIGKQLGLPIIAPLGEDGTFGEGFGAFTGKRATDPETAQMVFDSLKEKGLLVAVETYPHIYPFCWRTGDELVFRLVDEWFINMDWREEIKEVVDTIEWLPASIEGRDREREWLTNMRDWMISKKRFWGLALPIWANPDDPSDFEVMGSLAELKVRALALEKEGAKPQSSEAPGKPETPGTAGQASSGTLAVVAEGSDEGPHPGPLPGGEGGKKYESGWAAFEGHTPHRPWIDAVKIKSRKTGAVLSRIVDVGNPWLDAGIVPFSTLNYNEWKRSRELRDESREKEDSQGNTLNSQLSTLNWPEWYPPEFVVECFPGQFRNWFYSLLALSTMIRYDETDDPAEKRPFKTLLGHRLVMNEDGKPMHKSDGTAIWFEEAAEQLGVDTLRWLYLAQDPATDLRFGTRHKDEPVTLPTVDGPLSHTREGLPCCKVTSKPADEVRRQVLIPLWNSYAFFVNYARLDGFDPSRGPQITDPAVFAKLGEMDRWILSNLQQLIGACRTGFEEYDTASVCKAIAAFIDDLSNWYIRRSRRRFWRSAKEDSGAGIQDSGGRESRVERRETDNDKWEAYATLYEVLVTLSKLTGPVVPFLAERMYQNLVVGERRETRVERREERSEVRGQRSAAELSTLNSQRSTLNSQPISVHLCAYPEAITALIDSALSARMATAERIVGLGLRLRELENLRVRQPLATLQYVAGEEAAAHVAALVDVIAEELNVREIVRAEHLDGLVSYKYKPNKKTLGPKYGKQLGAIDKHLATAETDATVARALAPLRRGEPVSIAELGVTLAPEDVLIATERAGDWATADEGGLQIALSTALTPELVHEGMARDFVRHVQQARKDAGLEITDRIRVWYSGGADVVAAVGSWRDYIARETLADVVEHAATPSAGAKSVAIGEVEGAVWIERV